jgi:hypothetical protein
MQQRTISISLIAAIIVSLYIASEWMAIPSWDPSNLNDGSWHYALTRLRLDGIFLGKDVSLTYGPLAQYLGPMIRNGQLPSLPFYVVGFLYSLFSFLALKGLFDNVVPLRWSNALFLLGFFISLYNMPFTALCDAAFYFLTIILYFALYLERDNRRELLYVGALAVMALGGIEIKFSYGLHASVVFGLALLSCWRTLGIKRVIGATLLFISTNYLVFYGLTGSLKFHDFFLGSLSWASRYSEMAGNNGLSVRWYALGLLFFASFLILARLLTLTTEVRTSSGYFLMLSSVVSAFFLYKAGFIRLDAHAWIVYDCVIPLLFIMCAISAPIVETRYQKWLLITAVCLGAIGVAKVVPANAGRVYKTVVPPAKDHVVSLLLQGGFANEDRLTKRLRNNKPNLFADLDSMPRKASDRPHFITFAPWEVMFAHCTPGFEFSPIPGLQIYCESALRRSQALVQEYLSSDRAPDVIVLGNGTVDNRNEVADYTHWLEPLYRLYKLRAIKDDFGILEKRESPLQGTIVCSKNEPGLFLRAKAKPLRRWEFVLFALSKAVFKPPELKAVVIFRDGTGSEHTLTARCFLTLLQEGGMTLSDKTILELVRLLNDASQIAPQDVITEVVSASLVRSRGFDNLPVLPENVPIDVEICRPSGFHWRQ